MALKVNFESLFFKLVLDVIIKYNKETIPRLILFTNI